MKRGDLCLVQFPFTDASATKVRPVLVVSADSFNQGDDLVVLPLSSRPDANDPYCHHILNTEDFFSNTGLRCSSSVKWTKPVTLSKCVFQRRLGCLPGPAMQKILCKVRSLFGV